VTLKKCRLKFYLNFTVRFSEPLALAQSNRSQIRQEICKRHKICRNGKSNDGKTANRRPKFKNSGSNFITLCHARAKFTNYKNYKTQAKSRPRRFSLKFNRPAYAKAKFNKQQKG